MMPPVALSTLLQQAQAPSGAFTSMVHLPGGSCPDENAFVTGLVLRYLHLLGMTAMMPQTVQRAVTFLRRCESTVFPGMFGFWPRDGYPAWMGRVRLHADADDSAIVTLELVRCGVATMVSLQQLAHRVLSQHRFFSSRLAASDWRRCEVFLTWLHYDPTPNPVDCCVNANVLALLAYGGLRDLPGYDEACTMLNTAIRGQTQQAAFAALCPYYPHPLELVYAVEHAVATGAVELWPSWQHLLQQAWVQRHLYAATNAALPLCGHPERPIYWTAPVVQALRAYHGILRLAPDTEPTLQLQKEHAC